MAQPPLPLSGLKIPRWVAATLIPSPSPSGLCPLGSFGSTSQKVTYWRPAAGRQDLPILKAPPAGPNKLVWLLFTVPVSVSFLFIVSQRRGSGRLRGFEVNGCFYFLLLESGSFLGSCSIVPHRLLVSLEGSLPHTYSRAHKLGLMCSVATWHFFLKASVLKVKGYLNFFFCLKNLTVWWYQAQILELEESVERASSFGCAQALASQQPPPPHIASFHLPGSSALDPHREKYFSNSLSFSKCVRG